jgi:murein DD-endopeptidase MepM/ murein hydrolase activator NlpD
MFSWPLSSYKLTSPFGPRTNPITGKQQTHGGIDLAVPVGTYVGAVGSGKVGTIKREHPVAGNYVEIDHGGGNWSRYLHLSRIDVQTGQPIKVGQQVGLSGGGRGTPGAGASTGPHLHLEIWQGGQPYRGGKPTNPIPFLTRQFGKAAGVGLLALLVPGGIIAGIVWWMRRRRSAS